MWRTPPSIPSRSVLLFRVILIIQLVRYVQSPLFPGREDWRIRGTHLPLGYDKYAILAEHRNQKCVVICV